MCYLQCACLYRLVLRMLISMDLLFLDVLVISALLARSRSLQCLRWMLCVLLVLRC